MWHAPKTTAPLAPIATWVFKFVTNLKSPRMKLATNPMDSALRNMTLAACLNADVTISPSCHQGEKLERAGVSNLEVLSNVTETSGVATSLPAGKTLKLAWIGRFSPEKRLEVAIDGVELAQKRLAAEGLDPKLIELHIAGGPQRSGTPHIWHGILKPDGVADLLRNSHSLVLTSLGFDNQPMVVLEAFSHGRPVILTDPVLGKEFGDAALLTPTPHAEGLAERLVALVKSGNDLASHAVAATEFAKGTTAAVQAERLAALVR
jgi:glycosyltransferase involved in cell wall biosynthesis